GILLADRFDDERQLGPDARDPYALARSQRFGAGRPRAPELAVDEDQVVAAGFADLADHCLWPDGDWAAAHLYRFRQREHPDRAQPEREGGEHRRVDVVV